MASRALNLSIQSLNVRIFQDPVAARTEAFEIFRILAHYLQPGNVRSEIETALEILEPYFAKSVFNYPMLNLVVLELAKQIPSRHASQLKLARLMLCIGNRPERVENLLAKVLPPHRDSTCIGQRSLT